MPQIDRGLRRRPDGEAVAGEVIGTDASNSPGDRTPPGARSRGAFAGIPAFRDREPEPSPQDGSGPGSRVTRPAS